MGETEPLEMVSLALDRYIRKATRPRAVARHRLAVNRMMGSAGRAWAAWRAEMVRRLGHLRTPSEIDGAAWSALERRGRELFAPVQEKAFREGAFKLALHKVRTDPIGQAAKTYVATAGAKRIVEILEEVRDSVRSIITFGLDNGWGPAKVGRRLRPIIGLTDRYTAAVGNLYTGLLEQGIAEETAWARVEKYANHLQRVRAETIARTESNNALRQGIIAASKERGVELLDRIGDPEACTECVEANDAGPYTPDEAAEVSDLHPNDECTFVIHTGSEGAL
jgi:hypothetical protein